jgi:hypothetical protein
VVHTGPLCASQCRGCTWCHQPEVAAGPLVSDGTCSATDPSDAEHFSDCQNFCAAESWDTHCPLCKCKACSFCKCESSFEDDSTEPECQSWCTADYFEDHCSRCKAHSPPSSSALMIAPFASSWTDLRGPPPQCKGCGFCRLGPPCASSVPDDITYKACQSFCSPEFAASHCGMCKVRTAFCAPTGE